MKVEVKHHPDIRGENMAKYRKKTVIIEAIQFNGENQGEITDFMGEMIRTNFFPDIYIETLEGTMKANIGDYIIKGIKNEFYPCKPDIFEATYEKVVECPACNNNASNKYMCETCYGTGYVINI